MKRISSKDWILIALVLVNFILFAIAFGSIYKQNNKMDQFLSNNNVENIENIKLENEHLKAENTKLKEQVYYEDVKLHKCYLCDDLVKIAPVNDSFYIRCINCELQTNYFDSKVELVKYWNKEK